MKNLTNSAKLVGFIQRLILLEANTAQLYKNIADKVEMPLIKSFLLEISLDSQKHGHLLQGVVNSIPEVNWETKEIRDKIIKDQQEMQGYAEQIAEKLKIDQNELPELSEKLSLLESQMGEEYEVFVQVKTLDFFSGELFREYGYRPDKMQQIFKKIASDEEHHREILANIKEIIYRQEQKLLAKDPLREYRKIGVPKQ